MKPLKIKQSENEVKKAIKEYLELNGYEVYRINNSGTKRNDKKGNEFYTFNGTPGVADLYATGKGKNPLWIETKKTDEKPTIPQYNFGETVNASLGTYWIWADSFDMFLRIYNDIKNGYGLQKGMI